MTMSFFVSVNGSPPHDGTSLPYGSIGVGIVLHHQMVPGTPDPLRFGWSQSKLCGASKRASENDQHWTQTISSRTVRMAGLHSPETHINHTCAKMTYIYIYDI